MSCAYADSRADRFCLPRSDQLARDAGCDAHLAKPINKATLLRAIYDAVGGA